MTSSEEGEHGGAGFAAPRGLPFVSHGWGSPLSSVPAGDLALAHVDPCPASLNAARVDRPAPMAGPAHHPSPGPGRSGHHGLDRRAEAPAGLRRLRHGPAVPGRDDRPPRHELLGALLFAGFDVLWTGPPSRTAPGDRVRAEPFVSLPDVLPACALVVCHGGAGTTPAALAHAVPVVVLPRGAVSQHRMARACTARGAAATLDGGHPDVHSLIRAVRTGEYARHAAEVAREIAAAPDPAQIAGALERALG